MKKILIAALMWPLLALAQSYPNPTFQGSAPNSVPRTINSKLFGDFVNAQDFGAKCDGSTINTTSIQNALNIFDSNGGELLLPQGTCVSGPLTVPANVWITGKGAASTTLAVNSATADFLTFAGTGSGIRGVQLASTVPRTGGAYVKSAYGVVVSDTNVTGQYVGFNFVGASPSSLAVTPQLLNVKAYLPAVGAGSALAIFQNYSNAVVRNVVASGTASGQQPDYGLVFKNGDTTFVSDTNITRNGYALAVIPGAGENNYSLNVSNSDFDSAGVISGSINASSCLIQPTSTGNIYESHFANVWCGLAAGDGATIGSTGSGVVDGMHWSAGIFDGNGGSGFHIASNVSNWSATGGHAAGNTGAGYYVSAASSHWQLLGVRGGPVAGRGSNGSTGVNIGVNASSDFTIIADTNGNTGGTIFNGATGANQYVANNSTISGYATLASPAFTGVPTAPTAAAGTNTTQLATTAFTNAIFAAPPALGSTTPAAVSATTLSASSTVSGSGFSTYLASPPAIGTTTPAAGKFTTLQATGAITPSSTAGIVGTTTNDNASAGSVGEYPTATNLTGVSLTSGAASNGASISLTAGDWEVSGMCQFIPAGTTTISSIIVGVNTTSATLPGAPNETAIQGTLTTGAQQLINTWPARISLAGTTTVYTVCQAGFGTSTMTVNGYIRARRPR